MKMSQQEKILSYLLAHLLILLPEVQRALAFTDGEAETKRGKTGHTVNPSLNPDFQPGSGSDS